MALPQDHKTEFHNELVDKMYDKLVDLAQQRVSDESAARDIVQDVYLTAWEKIDDVMQSPNPHGWLVNALKNFLLRYFERIAAERAATAPLSEDIPASSLDLSDVVTVSFSSVLSEQEIKIVALKSQGYKHREIAEKLNLKPGTIDSAVSRIKTKIMKFLEDGGK